MPSNAGTIEDAEKSRIDGAEHQYHFMCRARMDQHEILCNQKPRCEMVMHDS